MRSRVFFTVFTLLTLAANIALSQINSFPTTESFEQAFATGNNVTFITNWTGNEVQVGSRIFQGANPRTGAASLNVIPISTFSGEILVSLNFTNNNNPLISFYAYSKQNGAVSSTRPILLNFATSIDGGTNYLDDVQIGDATSFPNDNTTSYTRYQYEPPAQSASQANVVVRISVARGDGTGSAAEFVMDDLLIEQQVTPLAISSVSANTNNTVTVQFNQAVSQASAENIANYAINNGISVQSATRTAANQVVLTTSAMFNSNYQLTINGVQDLATSTPSVNLIANYSYINPLSVVSINPLSKNSLEVIFNENLDETSAQLATNYTANNGIGNPSTAVRDNSNQKKVVLTFATDFTSQNYTLTINGVKDASTLANSTNLSAAFTYLSLEITALTVVSTTGLLVQFNQSVDVTTANIASNYSLNYGYGSPISATRDATDLNKVLLTFSAIFGNNTYTLTANNLTNLSGNASAINRQFSVTNSVQTAYRKIVINEVFADPTGSAQPDPQTLPSGSSDEFIEILNLGNQAVDLANFNLSGGTLGTFVLQPSAHVILTSTSNVIDYQSFGDVVGVSSWNSLANSGEQIILRDNLGNIVDSLTYDLSWYADNAKADGGWSIEQINPDKICSDASNWKASINASGATPAARNSVYDNSPDTKRPNLTSRVINTSQQMTLVFDEMMDLASLNGANYTINNGLSISSFVVNSATSKSVLLNLSSPLVSGNFYTVAVTGALDCAGNAIDKNQLTFYFDNLPPVLERLVFKTPTALDLVFNEELQQAVGEVEANFTFNQGIGNPAQSTLNQSSKNRLSFTLSSPLNEGTAYSLSYQNVADTLGNAILPLQFNFSFINQIDTAIVLSGQLLDIYFKSNVEVASAQNPLNYSVSGGIGSPESASIDNIDPKLVHLIFNTAFPENSQRVISFEEIKDSNSAFMQLLNTSFVYDTDDPDITGISVLSKNSVEVTYDEVVDQTSAEALNNYSANNGLGNPSRVTLQPSKKSVIIEFATDFVQELENRLSITAISDLAGNVINTTRNQSFIFDRLAPRLTGIQVTGPTTIEVIFSEEVIKSIAELTTNYSVDNGIGQPILAVRSEKNKNRVLLTFTSLGNNANNTLSIFNISDVFQNGLPLTLTASFSSLKPNFGALSVLNDTTIQVKFTKFLDKASAEDIENFGFDNGIGLKSIVLDPNDASLLRMNLTTRLKPGIKYRLVVQKLLDADGNLSNEISYDFNYSTHITNISVLNQNTLVLTFDQTLDEASAENIANYKLSDQIGNPLSAVRSSTDFNIVTLLFSNSFVEGIEYELTVQNLLDFYLGIISASKTKITYDITPPIVLAVNSNYLNEIEVVFNEALNVATAQTLNHYSLNNGVGFPSAVRLGTGSNNRVILSFNQNLVNGPYQLTVDRVQDKQGKAMAATNFNFNFAAPINAQFRELVINEIYFDTKPASSLPNAEFIEIYNRGVRSIELRDYKITDKRDTASLTRFILAPSEHISITTQGAVNQFLQYGQAIGVSNFPSLSNTGESLYLLDRNGIVIDSLAYDLTFYNDVSKQNGGFTVELINPEKACFDFTNYSASTAALGGTPGIRNSVYNLTPDTNNPILNSLEVISATQLKLNFSKAMDVSSFLPANFVLQNGITVASVKINDPFGRSVTLNLNAAFSKGISRSMTINNIRDCSGNLVLNSDYTFLLGDTPNFHDLIITEIMPTPSPSKGLPAVEYVEIYNRSNRIIELEGLFFADNESSHKLSKRTINPQAYLILGGNSANAALAGYGSVMAINSFPTLTIEDQAKLIDAQGNVIFEVSFDKSFYRSDAKDDGGYSIELINPEAICFDKSNWMASNSTIGGTPGIRNSVFDDTPDTTAPLVSSLILSSDQQLKIVFNESMDLSTMLASAFSTSNNLQVANIQVLDVFATEVLINLSSQITRGIVHTLAINGLKDCEGNQIANTSLDFYLGDKPGFQDLIITEIMANPSPSQGLPNAEYIELYNTTNRIISVAGILLSDGNSTTTLSSFNINPNQFLILTSAGDKSLLEPYGNVLGVISWPSLNTSGDNVSLFLESQEIHSVNYNQSWYRSTSKASGGYSLEMIDTNYPCVEQANWNATNAAIGGSPGAVNSVNGSNPDLNGPSIISAVVVDPRNLKIQFSEKVLVGSIVPANFSISGGIAIADVSLDEDGITANMALNSPLLENTAYQLLANNVTDCSGNLILTAGREATLVISVAAAIEDIIINELLFDPRSGGVRFIELYNKSNKYISLKDWRLEGVSNDRVISTLDIILAPSTYKTITSDGAILKSQYSNTDLSTVFELSSLPSIPADQGSVAIVSKSGVTVDMFEYNEDYHSPLLNSVDGVSLERIRFSGQTNDRNNWQSASSLVGYATPGIQNSQSQSAPSSPAIFNIEPKSFAPDIAGGANFTTINFNFQTSGNVLTVSVYDNNGNIVRELSQNTLVGTTGFFTWDGTTNSGNKARMGYYMILIQIIEPNGKISLQKETVAIGTRF